MTPTRDQTFMTIAAVMAQRSTCQRGNVGAIIVKDKRIISTGYNGSPPGMPECLDVGCLNRELYEWNFERCDYIAVSTGCQRAIHAEANALSWAARHGMAVEGATMFCTHGPCLHCAQLMATAGINRSVFNIPYRLKDGIELLDAMGIEAVLYDG